MRQLTGIDASFLYMETPSTFGHVSSLILFDPKDTPGAGYESTRAIFEHRLHLLDCLARAVAGAAVEQHPLGPVGNHGADLVAQQPGRHETAALDVGFLVLVRLAGVDENYPAGVDLLRRLGRCDLRDLRLRRLLCGHL